MRKAIAFLTVFVMSITLFASGENTTMPRKDGSETMEKAEWLEMQPTVNRPDDVTVLSLITLDQSEQSRDDLLSEDLEGGVVPPINWTLDNGTGSNGWEPNTSYVNSGVYSAFCNDYTGDQTTLLLSPAVDLSGEAQATLTFYQYGRYASYYNYHDVSVYVGGTLVGLVETGAGPSAWTQLAVDISSVAGGQADVQVGFYYSGNYADEWFIDDIAISTPPPPSLLISEYCDYQPSGYSGARFIEIYNPTDTPFYLGTADVDTNLYIAKYSNGSTSSYTTILEGTIAANDVFVVANNQDKFVEIFGFEADQYSSNISGNGDDVFALSTSGYPADPGPNVFDILGEIGVDGSGTAWDHLDQTIMRNDDVLAPNTVWTASEWTIGAGDETFATPGWHIIDPNVTYSANFAIDMNGTGYPNDTYPSVVINGSWNGWGGWGVTLLDEDAD